jgi:hypothetical protein
MFHPAPYRHQEPKPHFLAKCSLMTLMIEMVPYVPHHQLLTVVVSWPLYTPLYRPVALTGLQTTKPSPAAANKTVELSRHQLSDLIFT